MDLNVDDLLVTKCYDLEEERRKSNEAVLQSTGKNMNKACEQSIIERIFEEEKNIIMSRYKENISIISKVTKLSKEEINEIISRKRN